MVFEIIDAVEWDAKQLISRMPVPIRNDVVISRKNKSAVTKYWYSMVNWWPIIDTHTIPST